MTGFIGFIGSATAPMPEIPHRASAVDTASSSAARLTATSAGGNADPQLGPAPAASPVLARRSDTTRARSFDPGASTP